MMDDYAYLFSLAKRVSSSAPMTDATVSATATNASCGDECTVHLKVTNGIIEAVSVEATGCVISRASAGVLADAIIGPIGQISRMGGNDVRNLLGIPVSPLRERCLTTALNALQIAITKIK